MKVFVTWSGDLGREVADAIRDLWPDVISDLDVAMSLSQREFSVARFAASAEALPACCAAVIIVTRESQESPWLQFEAGTLATSITAAKTTLLLLDLNKADLLGPLAMFESVELSRPAVRDFLARLDLSRASATATCAGFDDRFESWWPSFGRRLKLALAKASNVDDDYRRRRSEAEVLSDVRAELHRLVQRIDTVIAHLPWKVAPAIPPGDALGPIGDGSLRRTSESTSPLVAQLFPGRMGSVQRGR